MFLKSKLAENISQVETSEEEQIWVVMSWLPRRRLAGVYIPPVTPYYRPAQYGALSEHNVGSDSVIVLGDCNARVGSPNLLDNNDTPYQYQDVKGDVLNEHGRTLMNICNDNDMVVVNHLCRQGRLFWGGLSFRRRDVCSSEMDLCIEKGTCVDNITDVHVDHDVCFANSLKIFTLNLPVFVIQYIR